MQQVTWDKHRRCIGWFEDCGISIGGVIVNEIIDKSAIDDRTSEFILNRAKMQNRYIEEVDRNLANICGVVSLFEREVKGLPLDTRVTETLFVPS